MRIVQVRSIPCPSNKEHGPGKILAGRHACERLHTEGDENFNLSIIHVSSVVDLFQIYRQLVV